MSTHYKVRTSRIHKGGKGVFAKKKILKGTKILRYSGPKLTKKQSENVDQTYLFELNSRYNINGKSHARYVNHSCAPNCEADILKGEIWILALRDILPGEELCYNYRYSYKEAIDYPCECGAGNCIGFMLADEEWYKVRRWKPKRPKAIRV